MIKRFEATRPLGFLVAPGPYKECLSANEVADAMCDGIRSIAPDLLVLRRPLSDGGTGIASLLAEATGGTEVRTKVADPLGRPILASYAMLGDRKTAVIESAKACGLALVSARERNPLTATSYGVGQLIVHAVEQSAADHIILGCGDSATNDCGIGMAAALGVIFSGIPQDVQFLGGKHLNMIQAVDTKGIRPSLRNVDLAVACNLTSILEGPDGTSRIYGPQKGASDADVAFLESGVANFCDVLFRQEGLDISFLPGAGGSGGLAASAYAFLGGRLLYSIDVVDRYLGLDGLLSTVDVVLTGEGTIDDRTATGKVACGLALKAKKFGLPVVAIVGAIAKDHSDIYFNGIDSVFAIQNGPLSLSESCAQAKTLIEQTTARVVRLILTTEEHRNALARLHI